MNSKPGPDWVIMGQFGRPHGILGEVKVHSFTEPFDTLLQYDWYTCFDKSNQPKLLKRKQNKHVQKKILAKIDGYDDRTKVNLLTNRHILVPKAQLPQLDQDEYYWFELVGMNVINTKKVQLGQVESIMSTGSNDVLVVHGIKKHLIPFLMHDVVQSVDKTHQLIIVDWDEDF